MLNLTSAYRAVMAKLQS